MQGLGPKAVRNTEPFDPSLDYKLRIALIDMSNSPSCSHPIILLLPFSMGNPRRKNSIPLNAIASPLVDTAWRDYPAGIGDHNALTTPATSLSARLSGLGEILFSDEIDLRVVDIRCDNGKYLSWRLLGRDIFADYERVGVPTSAQRIYNEAAGVENVLLQKDNQLPRIRIM